MKKLLVALFASVACLTSLSVRHEVTVGAHTVAVARAPGDGLDEIATTTLSLDVPEALAACASSDVRNKCCPAACDANKSDHTKGNQILRGCMKDLGCVSGTTDGTVFGYCSCGK
jgi:hypothetical protein